MIACRSRAFSSSHLNQTVRWPLRVPRPPVVTEAQVHMTIPMERIAIHQRVLDYGLPFATAEKCMDRASDP